MSGTLVQGAGPSGRRSLMGVLHAVEPALAYGVRLAAAVILALGIAYWLQLDNPVWAGTSAAIACQPSLGASLRKGRFRAIGTIIGAVGIVCLTGVFPQSRVGVFTSLALWGAVCGYLATQLRNFSAYSAALAGYTAAIVFADGVGAPNDTFLLSTARATEICLGVFCASFVFIVSDTGDARLRLADGLARMVQDIVEGLTATLAAGGDPPELRDRRRLLIGRGVALDAVADEAIGETTYLRSRSHVLAAAAEGLFTALAAWRGVATHLLAAEDPAASAEAAALIPMLTELHPAEWFDHPERGREACNAAAREILGRHAHTAAGRVVGDRCAAALLALRRAVNGLAMLRYPGRELPEKSRVGLRGSDPLPALVNAIRITITILAADLIWVETNWSGGETMVLFTAVAVILFSPNPQAYRAVIGFAIGTVLTAMLAAVVGFAVLPAEHDFTALALTLAAVLVPLGALSAGPWLKPVFAGLVMNFTPILAPANQQHYDPGAFLNSALAIVAGTIVAAVSFRLMPPVSAPFRVRLLCAITLRDLQHLAVCRRPLDAAGWTARLTRRLTDMPQDAWRDDLARVVAALSAGEAVIFLRTHRRPIGGKALDTALARLRGADVPGACDWLARYDAALSSGPAAQSPAVLRSRAAATVLADALARHADYFGSGALHWWRGRVVSGASG